MITRANRFHGHTSLHYVYRQGATARSASLSLRFVINSRRTRYRAAVVVSKKVAKSAITRNRIRRRIYEIIRRTGPMITGPFDLVITVHQDAVATMPAAQLEAEVVQLLTRAHSIPKV